MRVVQGQNLLIPRRDRYGEIQWRQPTTGLILLILRNPAYAGAFAYGQTRLKYENGVATKRRDHMPADQWKSFVKDKYPAYVSWEDFEKIGVMLRDNHSEYKERMTRGVPRDGKALLQGIVYCGHRGRKMTVQYKGKPRYNCMHRVSAAGEGACQLAWSGTRSMPLPWHASSRLSRLQRLIWQIERYGNRIGGLIQSFERKVA